jgi:hypothetical protein
VKQNGSGELGEPRLTWNVFLNAEVAEGTEKELRVGGSSIHAKAHDAGSVDSVEYSDRLERSALSADRPPWFDHRAWTLGGCSAYFYIHASLSRPVGNSGRDSAWSPIYAIVLLKLMLSHGSVTR